MISTRVSGMKCGCLRLSFILFLLTGCGVPREHAPQFVGHWKSGLPITSVAPSTSRIGQGINNDIRQIHRANNANGAQGVRLEIRADGTFTMTVKFAIEDLKSLMKDLNIEDQKLSGSEDSYDGTWHSEGDAIVLTSESFLPYAMTAVTRNYNYRPRSIPRETKRPFLPLFLRNNGKLSQFRDEVRPGTHETGLDFQRQSD